MTSNTLIVNIFLLFIRLNYKQTVVIRFYELHPQTIESKSIENFFKTILRDLTNKTMENTPYDLTTYNGRFLHFLRLQNPLNVFCTDAQLSDAKSIISTQIEKDESYWTAKYIYDSAYHPTTKEQVVLPGRMCFQAPGNSAIALGMLTFYRSPIHVFGGQFINQGFNGIVNYANAPQPVFKLQVMLRHIIGSTIPLQMYATVVEHQVF